MRKKTIFAIALTVGLLIGLAAANLTTTGKTTYEDKYTYTTAICNENKECIDVLVSCQDNQVLSIEPTSNLIKLEKNWQDPRQNTEITC